MNPRIRADRNFHPRLSIAVLFLSCIFARQIVAQVPAADARNTNLPDVDTALPLPSFSTLEAWLKRRAFLRNQILVSAGLSPMPAKAPLHAQVFGKLEARNYTIEKVLLEPFPGFYLGGNLYRPRDGRAKHPAILNPQGHWPYGRLENESDYSAPSLGISLARQGYVVFAYDMVGYNDTLQVPHRFGSPEQRLWSFGPLGLQLWDSIRALDFVASLPDVDPAHLGAVGASGGGTQTFLLAAVDDRIRFAAPVNMVSAIMQGGDLCENAPGLRIGTSNVEIAALFAPKPMLLVSATGDWTRNVPRNEFPAIQRIYALYGKADQVEVVQIDAPHNFNRQSREAVYRFLAKQSPNLTDPRELVEHNLDIPMVQQLEVLSNRTLPAGALDLDGLFHLWIKLGRAQNEQRQDDGFLRDRLRQTLAIEIPPPEEVVAERNGESVILSRSSRGDRVAGKWIGGHGAPALVVERDGSAAALNSALVKRLRGEGRPILVIDAFQTGAAEAPRPGDPAVTPKPYAENDTEAEDTADAAAGYPRFLTFNVSVDAARVQDIVTALVYLRKTDPNIDLYASGDAALWATFAAAVLNQPLSLHEEDAPVLSTDADYVKHFNVPGILRAGGLPIAEKLVQNVPRLKIDRSTQ
jgi:dienelactone hydrolase